MSRTTFTRSPSTRQSRPPLAAALGLLVSCGVTLIGVASGLSPDVILLRTCIAGGLTVVSASCLMAYWKMVSPPREED